MLSYCYKEKGRVVDTWLITLSITIMSTWHQSIRIFHYTMYETGKYVLQKVA